jgi:hypothetical protein
MADAPTQLDYAQPRSWRRRKGVRRGILLAVLLLAGLGSVKFLGSAWDHLRLLYYQGRCLGHAEQGGRVVYDGTAVVGKVDRDWERFYALFSPPGGQFSGTVFLGELKRPDGERRLVSVDLAAGKDVNGAALSLDYQVIKPAKLWERAALCSNRWWAIPWERHGAVTRVYAGEKDPVDASHFTIAIERGGKREVIDGWLRGDDRVLLEGR